MRTETKIETVGNDCMLGIFLGILKWLGILLLVLLGLVLTVLLAVLFLPVRYEAEGSFRGELLAKGQISWLWRLFSIQAVYDGDTEVSLRIFGVKPGRKKETAERTEKTETPDPVVTGSGKRPEEEVPVYESRPKAEVPASEKHQGTEEGIKEKVPAAGTKNAKNGQKKKRVRQSLFQKIKVTFQRICGKLKTAEERWQKLMEFLEKEENKNTFRLLKRQVIRFFKHVLPGKVSGTVRFGFEDPYTTGRILTYISPFYGWYGRTIQVIPVFDEQVLDGELSLKGRIRIATLLFIGFQVWRDKNFRTLLKRWQAAY